MGGILSRYRRKKTSEEILEEIQSNIESLENDREVVVQRQNYVVGKLIIYSIILYVISALVFYFCFFPASLTDRLFYVIPLLIFPLLIILLRKFVTWYYKREISSNKDKLSELRTKKKQILEDVMNKETYKIAKEILEKYAPEKLKKPELGLKPFASNLKAPSPKETNNAILGPKPSPQLQQLQVARLQQTISQQPPIGFSPVHQKSTTPMVLRRQGSPQGMQPSDVSMASPAHRLVRPIIPKDRNLMDRFIESIVGDGPSNRYALICRNCASHNGMALKEEFEYLAFRCAYCGFPNPSHKVRPPISISSSRSSSEERKSIAGPIEIDNRTQKSKADEEIISNNTTILGAEDHSDGGPVEEEFDTSKADLAMDISKSEADSDESGSTPTDGVRPRKPLHLSD